MPFGRGFLKLILLYTLVLLSLMAVTAFGAAKKKDAKRAEKPTDAVKAEEVKEGAEEGKAKEKKKIVRKFQELTIEFALPEMSSGAYFALDSDYLYYQEQPLKFYIRLTSDPYAPVRFNRSDWYNILDIRYRLLNSKKITNTKKDFMKTIVQKHKAKYKVLERDSFWGNRLAPDTEMTAIIELRRQNKKPFLKNSIYRFCVRVLKKHLAASVKTNEACKTINIINPKTPAQKIDYYLRKASYYNSQNKLRKTIGYYKKALELKDENDTDLFPMPKYEMMLEIAGYYKRLKKPVKAKKYVNMAISAIDKKIDRSYTALWKKYDLMVKRKSSRIPFDDFAKKEKVLYGNNIYEVKEERKEMLVRLEELTRLEEKQEKRRQLENRWKRSDARKLFESGKINKEEYQEIIDELDSKR